MQKEKEINNWISYIYLFITIMWIVSLAININNIFLAIIFCIIPAIFLKKSMLYLKKSLPVAVIFS